MAGNFNRTNNFNVTGDYVKDWELLDLAITESVAFEMGSAVAWDGSTGKLIAVTDSTTNFAGILANEIASTDDDFATAFKRKQVWAPKSPLPRALFTVGSGTFAVEDVGKSVKFNDALGLGVDTAGIQARIVQFISPTRGVCVFNLDIV